MIRFKRIRKQYPNGLVWADYHMEDIPREDWYVAVLGLIDLIKADSTRGWAEIFRNFLTSLRTSVFYPVVTSFDDWQAPYSIGSNLLKFESQLDALLEAFGIQKDGRPISWEGHDAGIPFYPTREGRGSRWLYSQQMKRISAYHLGDLLEMLYTFSAFGGAIPIAGWENKLNYGSKIKQFCQNYAEYLKAAYLLPPSWYLEDIASATAGATSWLELLSWAGVLGEGVLVSTRGHRCIARDGHECYSLGELEIDNWLSLNSIPHEKEPPYPRHALLNPAAKLRADFRVKEFFIEYAGLIDDPEYSQRIEIKRELARDAGINLIVLTPEDLTALDEVLRVVCTP